MGTEKKRGVQLPCVFVASGICAHLVREEGDRIVVYTPCLCCVLTLIYPRQRVPVALHILSGEILLFQEKRKVDRVEASRLPLALRRLLSFG